MLEIRQDDLCKQSLSKMIEFIHKAASVLRVVKLTNFESFSEALKYI